MKCQTICVNCTHHNGVSRKQTWYDHFCHHPEVRLVADIDPVTGKEGYAKTNDLGNAYLTDSPYPYCRDINRGNCPHFESNVSVARQSR